MPDQWTSEHILALAPDASSAKNGRGLATMSKWASMGSHAPVIWGECQGSGKNPYRCSCPSRKFPCKHGLALFLLFAEQPAHFSEQAPPDWVAEWIQSRSQRAEKQSEKQAKQEAKQADPVAQAKRVAAREKKVQAGIQDLRLWLEDRIRQGLIHLQQEPYQTWETMAARMVDAQAPGLARRLRSMAGLAHSGSGWMHPLLAELGQLYLLLDGYERLDTLPDVIQADIKTQIGWTINQEEVLASPVRADLWLVVGQRTEDEDRLKVRRTWLWGLKDSQPALLLDFAHGNQPWEQTLLLGTALEAELTFYPSAYPLRALVKTQQTGALLAKAPPGVDIATAIAHYHQARARCPWLERFPLLLQAVVPVQTDEQWLLHDHHLTTLPLASQLDNKSYWTLLALSGGYPVTVFGEWNGLALKPLSVWVEDALYAVGA
jgi:hypothetical protein